MKLSTEAYDSCKWGFDLANFISHVDSRAFYGNAKCESTLIHKLLAATNVTKVAVCHFSAGMIAFKWKPRQITELQFKLYECLLIETLYVGLNCVEVGSTRYKFDENSPIVPQRQQIFLYAVTCLALATLGIAFKIGSIAAPNRALAGAVLTCLVFLRGGLSTVGRERVAAILHLLLVALSAGTRDVTRIVFASLESLAPCVKLAKDGQGAPREENPYYRIFDELNDQFMSSKQNAGGEAIG